MIMARCSECGESINRYRLKTLLSLFRIAGGFYTHKCKHCKTSYAPSSIFLLALLAVFIFVDLPEIDLNAGLAVFLIVLGFVFAIAYLLPLSVFFKPDYK